MGSLIERRIGDLTIRINPESCISTGNCMKLAPEVFAFDAETICTFADSLGEIEPDRLIEACHVCPVDALFVIDATGKQLVP